MKHLPKSTPTEILNDPYGFTYKEMSEVIGEDKARTHKKYSQQNNQLAYLRKQSHHLAV